MKTRIINKQWRIDEGTGFLTITASLLKSGPLGYSCWEMDNIPEHVTEEQFFLDVPESEISKPESLKSLEGLPVVVGHTWQDIGTSGETSVGNIKGSPWFDDGYVYADLLITDPETIQKIKREELVDISTAYDCEIAWEMVNSCLGSQSDITYNHVALLPKGYGRAGHTVRILNQSTEKPMSTTSVRLQNGTVVKVANEDADKLMAADKEQSDQINNMVDPAKLQETLDKLEEIKKQMDALSDEKGDLEGQVKALRDQLDSALSPEQIEVAAAEMVENREKAERIMNSKGLKLEEKLNSHALKRHVVEQIRIANQKPLSKEELDNEAMINGMFEVYADMAQATPTGHQVVNAGQNRVQNSAQSSAQDYKTALWGAK